jgi:septum formation protein
MHITKDSPLCLGSGSPRRRELLTNLRLPLRVVPADVEEAELPGEGVEAYLERIVRDKLRAVGQMKERIFDCAAVLVADTVVILDGRILQKPRDSEDAERMLQALSGRHHVVMTRFAFSAAPDTERPLCERTVRSEVTIRALSAELCRRYAATGEGLDKAGAYAAQGLGAFLVERIEGSYFNVVGLPVCEVVGALLEHGLLRDFP